MTDTIVVTRTHHSNAPEGTERSYIVTMLVANRPGSVDRVVGVLRRRRSMLRSLSFGESTQADMIYIAVRVRDAEVVIDHLVEQLRKIIDVHSVESLSEQQAVVRELAIIQVSADAVGTDIIINAGQQSGATVVAQTAKSVTFEVVGDSTKVEQALRAFQPYGIVESARSGGIALSHVANACK